MIPDKNLNPVIVFTHGNIVGIKRPVPTGCIEDIQEIIALFLVRGRNFDAPRSDLLPGAAGILLNGLPGLFGDATILGMRTFDKKLESLSSYLGDDAILGQEDFMVELGGIKNIVGNQEVAVVVLIMPGDIGAQDLAVDPGFSD